MSTWLAESQLVLEYTSLHDPYENQTLDHVCSLRHGSAAHPDLYPRLSFNEQL